MVQSRKDFNEGTVSFVSKDWRISYGNLERVS